MKIELELACSEEEFQAASEAAGKSNAGPLRDLCQKEVERFEQIMRQHPDYSDGLVMIERRVVEGYLYQKLRGHLNETTTTSNLPEEG